jgi:hypothetical protein
VNFLILILRGKKSTNQGEFYVCDMIIKRCFHVDAIAV